MQYNVSLSVKFLNLICHAVYITQLAFSRPRCALSLSRPLSALPSAHPKRDDSTETYSTIDSFKGLKQKILQDRKMAATHHYYLP
ncbi:hypothetical protein VNO77_00007 [Canavalia gladiata]|uniref:Uncharacterized protein n=1 Tax=Canavalia gladiata TaxID=3824 RepID=A0AAN9R415_CANGL